MKIIFLFLFVFFQCYCLEYSGFDTTLCKGLAYLSFILMWLYSFVMSSKLRLCNISDAKPQKALYIIALGMLISIIPAKFIEGQSFFISIMTTIGIVVPLLSYGIIRRLKISSPIIERLVIVFGFVYVIIVIVNFTTFPNMLFGSGEMDEDRGGIRIRSNMIMFGVLSFFYFINAFLIKKKIVFLIYAFIMFVAVSSSLFRVYILLMLGLSTIMILKYSSARRRFLAILIIVVIGIIIPQTTVYNNLVEVSEAQKEISENSKEDVRLQAYKYFLYESQTGITSILLGHGIASIGHSAYGKRVEVFQENTGIYQTDVGWAGGFYNFGIIPVAVFFFLLIWAVRKKKTKELRYLSYFYGFYLLGGFTNSLFSPIYLLLLIMSLYVLNHRNKDVTKIGSPKDSY